MTDAGGGFDLGGLLEQAQAMQAQMEAAQAAQAETVLEGSAGGGKVTVQMTGAGAFVAVSIAPDVVDPDDVEILEDLVLAALRDAGEKVMELQEESMGEVGMPDLGSLGGLLGGE